MLCLSDGGFTLVLFVHVSAWAELLSQLSGVRRSAGGQLNSSGPSASQLQQLQMQLQLERQQAQAARQQLETARNATRQRSNPSNISASIPPPSTATNTAMTESNPLASHSSQFLLTRYATDIIATCSQFWKGCFLHHLLLVWTVYLSIYLFILFSFF